jgi:outer membrane lipoprotein-sorting protein
MNAQQPDKHAPEKNPFASMFHDEVEPLVPPDIRAQALRRLAALRAMMATDEIPAGRRTPAHPARPWRRPLAYFVPATALLAAALVFWLSPTAGDRSSAYAAALKQFHGARTLTFKALMEGRGAPQAGEIAFAFQEPGRMRIESPAMGAKIVDMTLKQALMIDRQRREYARIDFSNMPQPMDGEFDPIELIRGLPGRASRDLGVRAVDGLRAHGYRVLENGLDFTVWVDENTRALHRIDMTPPDASGFRVQMWDFQFDQPLDPALFDMTVPEGYTPMSAPPPWMRPDRHLGNEMEAAEQNVK